MNKQALFFGMLSLVWVIGGSSYVGNLACSAVNALLPLELKDGSRTFQTEGHFSFGLSSAELKMDEEITPFFSAISDLLQEDPNKSILLTGKYLTEELNLSESESLGLARAEAIKASFVKLGTPENQILLQEETLEDNTMINNVLYDGVDLEIVGSLSPEVETITIPENEALTFEPTNENLPLAIEKVEAMTLYGDAVFSLDLNPSMQHYIDKISAFLTDHPKANLQITGHTQELGSIVKNADRSLELARKVRRFFRTNGINYRRIKTNAKGATEPILTPDYPDAASKNNRVEISILEN